VVVPGTSRPVTSQGFPIGFLFSEEPTALSGSSGLDVATPERRQFHQWTADRFWRDASISSILRPCPPGTSSANLYADWNEVDVGRECTDPDNDQLLYTWSVTGGRLSGEGAR
jgi:hypothetical protein